MIAVSRGLGINSEELRSLIEDADPTINKKYQTWLLKQLKFKNLRLPEDRLRAISVLTTFHKLKTRFKFRDIMQYLKFQDLESEADRLKGVETKGDIIKDIKKQGIRDYRENKYWKIIEVTTPEAASWIAQHTKWCTSDPSVAREYLYEGPLYVIFKKTPRGLEKWAQYTPDFEQFKDVRDRDVIDQDTGRRIPTGLAELIKPDLGSDASTLLYYAEYALNARWPEAEPYIMRDPWVASQYARWVIKGRWPEAEDSIMKDPEGALRYVQDVLQKRWPEAETHIFRDPEVARKYRDYTLGLNVKHLISDVE